MFRFEELTYPLTVDTIGKTLATGAEITVHCQNQDCVHQGRINLVKLGYRIGFDHSSMATDLMRYFYCPKCREAGRPDKNVGFIGHSLTEPHSSWPRRPYKGVYER